jgi:aldehyde dehydrogenase (NAD+)
LKLAAKKELFGENLNADKPALPRLYLDSKDMKNKFIDYLKEEITAAYSNNQKESPDFARIVNVKIGID